MTKQNTSIEHRLTKVETLLHELMTNHLVHLAGDIKTLNDKIDENNKILTKKIDDNNTKSSSDIEGIKLTMTKWSGIIVGASAIIQLVINFIK